MLTPSRSAAVMWPSAVVLSRWLMSHPATILGKRVIELGAGCGLTGLVAAKMQSTSSHPDRQTVLLTDFNPIVVDNLRRNAALNDLAEHCSAVELDFYQQTGREECTWKDMNGTVHQSADVVLAADMICQPDDAVAAANAVYDTLVPGGKGYCVCADSKHRFGVDQFAADCERVGLSVKTYNVRDMMEGKLLQCELEKTAGYVEGMTLTFFELEKPAQ